MHRNFSGLKWLFLSVSVGSLLLAFFFMWAAPKPLLDKENGSLSEQSEGTHTEVAKPWIVERKGERMLWRLQADVANQQGDGMHLTLPVLELFTEGGERVLITSKSSWYEPIKKDIKFMGNVMVSYRGWQLQTNTLVYVGRLDQIRIPGKFHMQREGVTMQGRTMTLDHNSEKMSIEHDVWVQDARDQHIGST